MNFRLRATDADAQGQQNPMYRTQSSSTYTYFAEQAMRAGLPSGNFGGGGHEGPEMFRGRAEMREAIQRELEKERIREEILAEEMARKRILEAEVRQELMMEREMMTMRRGGGFSSPLSLPPSHNNLFDPRILHQQPIGLEERIAMSLEEKYGRGGHRREIKGFEVAPFLRLGDSPKIKGIPTPLQEDCKKEVIVLGKPNGETLSGRKRRSITPVAGGSSEPCSDSLKKKLKEEWSCAICHVSATSERALNEHLQGKKHQAKEAALIAQKTGANFGLGVEPKKPIVKPVKLALTTVTRKESVKGTPSMNKTSRTFDLNDSKKEDGTNGEHKREKFKFWCEMCQVGAFSEKVMNNHKEGKKHLTHLVEQLQKGNVEAEAPGTEKTCDTEEKTKAETKKAVVVEVVAAEVKSVEDHKQDVTAKEPDTLVEEREAEVKTVKDDMEDVTAKEPDTLVEEYEAEVKTVKDDMEDVTAEEEADTMVAVGNLGDNMIKTGVAEDVNLIGW